MQIYCYLNCVSLSFTWTDWHCISWLSNWARCLPFPIKSHHLADKRANDQARWQKQADKEEGDKRSKRRRKQSQQTHQKRKKHIWQTLVKCTINRSRQQLTLFGQFAAAASARQSICSRPAHSHNSTIMVRKMVNVCVDSLNRFDRWWWSLRGMGTTTTTAAGDAAVWLVSLTTKSSDSGSAVSPGERLIRRWWGLTTRRWWWWWVPVHSVMCCVRWCSRARRETPPHRQWVGTKATTDVDAISLLEVRGSVAVFFYYLSMNNHWPALSGQFAIPAAAHNFGHIWRQSAEVVAAAARSSCLMNNSDYESQLKRRRQNCPIIARHHCHHHHHHCLCQSSERKKDDVVVVVEVDDYRRWRLRKRRKEEKTSLSLQINIFIDIDTLWV